MADEDEEAKTERVEVRAGRAWLKGVDDWRRDQADLPGRGEAIRRLVDLQLKGKKRR